MLTVFASVIEDLLPGEVDILFIEDGFPIVGECIGMGGDRPWKVMKIEDYFLNDESLSVALVAPDGEPTPDESIWTHNILRDGEQLSLCVHTNNGFQVSYEWLLLNTAPSDRITAYEPTDHPTLMRAKADEWKVASFDVFLPMVETPIFDRVYISKVLKLEPVAA